MRPKVAPTRSEPDGKCHAVAALIEGCTEPVGEGLWSCHRHHVRTYKRGQELIALAGEREVGGAPSSIRSNGRDRTGAVEKARDRRGRSE